MTTRTDAHSHKGPLVMDLFSPRAPPVDRRNAIRNVPMKLLCLGLSRTGTQSLREALFRAGYEDVYHQTNVNQNQPHDAELWTQALRNKFEGQREPWTLEQWRRFFDAIVGHCMAVTDVPAVTFWNELMEAYPDAKVLVTIRDSPETWYTSFMETSMPLLSSIYGKGILPWLVKKTIPQEGNMVFADLLLKYDDAYHACFQDYLQGTRNGIDSYDRHIKAVQHLGQQHGRDVLLFNVKEGWEPLCHFLGVKQPPGTFPRINDKQYFQLQSNKLRAAMIFGVTISIAKYAFAILLGGVATLHGLRNPALMARVLSLGAN